MRTLEEDLKNPSLLYLGTEFGFWVSLDRGAHWTRLAASLTRPRFGHAAAAGLHGKIYVAGGCYSYNNHDFLASVGPPMAAPTAPGMRPNT